VKFTDVIVSLIKHCVMLPLRMQLTLWQTTRH